MSKHIVFTFNPNTCINCKTCEMACNEYYNLSGSHRRKLLAWKREINLHEVEPSSHKKEAVHNFNDIIIDSSMQISIACAHCLNPVCVYICPENNFQKRRDGIVVLEASNCKLCKKCINACPLGAIKINANTNRMDKCNFCVERVRKDLRPICIDNCITGSLGRMILTTKELKANMRENSQLPIVNYVNPAIFIIKDRVKEKSTDERLHD